MKGGKPPSDKKFIKIIIFTNLEELLELIWLIL